MLQYRFPQAKCCLSDTLFPLSLPHPPGGLQCKGIAAAAIFGTAEGTVDFIDAPTVDRFQMLESGQIDVLARLTTHNMERDVYEMSKHCWAAGCQVRVLRLTLFAFQPSTGVGFSFSTPYLYNGLSYGGLSEFVDCADRRDTATGNCTQMKMCVLDSTTHVPIMTALFPSAVVLAPSIELMYERLIGGFCNLIAGEQFEISESVVRKVGYIGPYTLLTNVLSKDPISLVTRQTDARWSDFVNWVLVGLMHAEERNAVQNSAVNLGSTSLFGSQYRLMFVNAVAAVGNYGEMYERHLQRIVPRSAINEINSGDNPLIYSFPYGNLLSQGKTLTPNGTIEQILARGTLRCGVSRQAGFADFDPSTQVWTGYDVDYCRAIAAALFDGVTNVEFVTLTSLQRFTALQNGNVDVLCRVTTATASRDVFLPEVGTGFTFTQTTFYDGLAFGGVPP